MSTWWYFECVDHDPPLKSADEFTQHTDDAAFHAGIELASNRPVDNDWDYDRDYFEVNARRFLTWHPKCRLELVNEYGDRRTPTGLEGGAR